MNKIKIFVSTFFLSLLACFAHGDGSSEGYIVNPLKFDSTEGLIQAILDIVVKMGSVVAVLFLIYSGFLFVKARGNPGEISKAQETFMWTIVGIAILLGAKVISTVVVGTVTSISR